MIRLLWNASVAIHALLRYAPTNLLLAAIRTPRGLKWGPFVLLLVPVYLLTAGICYTLVERGGPGWLAFLGFLFLWNMFKCAWASVITTIVLLRNAVRRLINRSDTRRHARKPTGTRDEPTSVPVVRTP